MPRYDTLSDLIIRYENLRRDLELSLRLRRVDDDLAGEIDFLSNRIATLQAERDGEPLESLLREQARDEREARSHYERGVV